MTTTLPTIYPVGYSGTTTDFNQVKADRSGALRIQTGTVAVPNSTASGTLIGLLPFVAGLKVLYGSAVYTDAMGTSVAFNIGWTYYDSTLGTSQAAGFVSGSTVAAAGGMIPFTASSGSSLGMVLDAAASGWITVTPITAAVGSSGNIEYSIAFAYDPSGVTNP
jgi:hypothetical protein